MPCKRWSASPAVWRCAAAVAVLALQAGCTVVRIHNAEVQTQLLPGLAVIRVLPQADQLTLVRSQGLGFSFGPRQATLGLLTQTSFLAQGPQACGSFFVTDSAQAQAELQQWLLAQPQLSVLQPCVFTFNPESAP